jgi:anti-sigma regulatory factor (Ser/Thr protein kinase)
LSHSVAAYSTTGVCANCSAVLPEDARLEIVSEPPPTVSQTIQAGLGAPAVAREAASRLPLGNLALERLALVVSELVTNSLRHAGLAAGEPIDLELIRDNGYVRVSVRDGGPGFRPSRSPHAPGPNGGFGLAIVAALTQEWGVDFSSSGFAVWCAVDVS